MQKIRQMLPQRGLLRLHLNAAARGAVRQAAVLAFSAAAVRGTLFGVVAPFGTALALGAAEETFLAAAAGAALGTLLWQSGGAAVAQLCVLAAVAVVRWVQPRRFLPAAVGGGGTLGFLLLLLYSAGSLRPDAAAALLAGGVLAGALGWEMRRRPVRAGGAGLLVPGAAAVAVLAAVPAGPLLPGAVFCTGAGLVLACRGRREQAALGITALAVTLCAADPALAHAAVGLCGGTLLAAWLAPGQRLRCAAWFALGCLPGALCAPDSAAALRFLLAAAIGTAGFFLMPQRLVLAVPDACPEESGGRPAVSAAATRLAAVAESLSGIAETVNGVYAALPKKGETFAWVTERTHDELCAGCARREECWQERYNDTVSGLFRLRPALERTGRVELEDLPGGFSRCIHPAALCAAVSRAWAQYCGRRKTRIQADALRAALTEQYGAVAQALADLSGQLGTPGSPEPYKTGRVAALFASLGMEPLECAVTRDADGRLQAAVTVPRAGLNQAELAALAQETGRVCHRPLELPRCYSCRGSTTLLFQEKPALRPVFGMAGCPAGGEGEISGDAVQQFCSANAAEMILCDGMGTGRPAAVDGNLAAELTARLLRAGFAPETAARLINVALALKSDEEGGTTLDLLQVDLYTGAARLFKAGAAPGFVVQGGRARLIAGPGLPMGILNKVSGQTRTLHLSAGDWAVLVSDGVLVDGPDWVLQQLELCAAAGDTPGKAAALLVKMARSRAGHTGRPDDITAAVMRLEKYI